jgi:hypothetical protein
MAGRVRGRVMRVALSINDELVAEGESEISTFGLFFTSLTSRDSVLPGWLPRAFDRWAVRLLEPLIGRIERDSRGRTSGRNGLERLVEAIDCRVSVTLRDGTHWYFLKEGESARFRVDKGRIARPVSRPDARAAPKSSQPPLRVSGSAGKHVVLMTNGEHVTVDVFFADGGAREQDRLALPAEVVVVAPSSAPRPH